MVVENYKIEKKLKFMMCFFSPPKNFKTILWFPNSESPSFWVHFQGSMFLFGGVDSILPWAFFGYQDEQRYTEFGSVIWTEFVW